MPHPNHYETLKISQNASQEEIKQAYRRLVKLFHPDINPDTSDREQIIQINAAYEVLSDTQRRRRYDSRLGYRQDDNGNGVQNRQERTAAAQRKHRSTRQSGKDADTLVEEWIKLVYQPVNRIISKVLKSLKSQIEELAADPFDDDLLAAFQDYLDSCSQNLKTAQNRFSSRPNPPSMARTAAHIYYCLNQISDALDELGYFPTSYDESYLHNGSQMFRTARQLQREAQESVKNR